MSPGGPRGSRAATPGRRAAQRRCALTGTHVPIMVTGQEAAGCRASRGPALSGARPRLQQAATPGRNPPGLPASPPRRPAVAVRTRGLPATRGLLGVVVCRRSFFLLRPPAACWPFPAEGPGNIRHGEAGLRARRVDESLSNGEAPFWKLFATLATVLPPSRPLVPLNSPHLGAAEHLHQPGPDEGLKFYQ